MTTRTLLATVAVLSTISCGGNSTSNIVADDNPDPRNNQDVTESPDIRSRIPFAALPVVSVNPLQLTVESVTEINLTADATSITPEMAAIASGIESRYLGAMFPIHLNATEAYNSAANGLALNSNPIIDEYHATELLEPFNECSVVFNNQGTIVQYDSSSLCKANYAMAVGNQFVQVQLETYTDQRKHTTFARPAVNATPGGSTQWTFMASEGSFSISTSHLSEDGTTSSANCSYSTGGSIEVTAIADCQSILTGAAELFDLLGQS